MSTTAQEKKFNAGFNNWISSALQYEHYRKAHRAIPSSVKRAMDKAHDWLSNLSSDEYDRLIH